MIDGVFLQMAREHLESRPGIDAAPACVIETGGNEEVRWTRNMIDDLNKVEEETTGDVKENLTER